MDKISKTQASKYVNTIQKDSKLKALIEKAQNAAKKISSPKGLLPITSALKEKGLEYIDKKYKGNKWLKAAFLVFVDAQIILPTIIILSNKGIAASSKVKNLASKLNTLIKKVLFDITFKKQLEKFNPDLEKIAKSQNLQLSKVQEYFKTYLYNSIVLQIGAGSGLIVGDLTNVSPKILLQDNETVNEIVTTALGSMIILGPVLEEESKKFAELNGFTKEYFVVFNSIEFSIYLIRYYMINGTSGISKMALGRLLTVGVHGVLTLLHKKKFHKTAAIIHILFNAIGFFLVPMYSLVYADKKDRQEILRNFEVSIYALLTKESMSK